MPFWNWALECAVSGYFFGLPVLSNIYTSVGGSGLGNVMLRGVVAAICLLPPTLLMGATLPAISRGVEATPRGVSWLGFFYGGNIAGATLGCLLAGFYLLREHNMAYATYVALGINVLVAVFALILAGFTPHQAPEEQTETQPLRVPRAWAVYVALALSGFAALGAEVVWTRLLSLMIGATVYTFSIILAVFLLGLGIGSSVGSFLARTVARPRFAFGVCQALLVVASAWTIAMITRSLPVLADQPATLLAVVHLPTRSGALSLGNPAANDSLGGEFPAGSCGDCQQGV